MIKDLTALQENSKNADFAKQLTAELRNKNIDPSPIEVSRAFNKYSSVAILKPHTVRKWLLGVSKPRNEMLFLLAEWLDMKPQELLNDKQVTEKSKNKVSFEFDFTDQEVISKYLAMTVKQKVTVRLVIDAITDKHK